MKPDSANPTCQHGDGGVMIWASFKATGPGNPAVFESAMNSEGLQSQMWALSDSWRYDATDPANQGSSHSPDLILTEMVRFGLQRPLQKEMCTNFNELTQCWKKESVRKILHHLKSEKTTSSQRFYKQLTREVDFIFHTQLFHFGFMLCVFVRMRLDLNNFRTW